MTNFPVNRCCMMFQSLVLLIQLCEYGFESTYVTSQFSLEFNNGLFKKIFLQPPTRNDETSAVSRGYVVIEVFMTRTLLLLPFLLAVSALNFGLNVSLMSNKKYKTLYNCFSFVLSHYSII